MNRNVFISHAAADKDLARQLADQLTRLGAEVFSDEAIVAGTPWADILERALLTSDAYVVLVTPEYVQSQWSQFETGVAASRANENPLVRVIPVVAKGASWSDVPPLLRTRKGLDANRMRLEEVAAQVSEALAA